MVFAGVMSSLCIAFKEKPPTPFVTQLQVPSATQAVQKDYQAITCVLIAEFCSMRHRKGTMQAVENCTVGFIAMRKTMKIALVL